MQNLPTDSKDDSPQEHDSPYVAEASKTVNNLSNNTDRTGDDEHDSWSDFIDQDSTDEGHYDIGEGIQGIK